MLEVVQLGGQVGFATEGIDEALPGPGRLQVTS